MEQREEGEAAVRTPGLLADVGVESGSHGRGGCWRREGAERDSLEGERRAEVGGDQLKTRASLQILLLLFLMFFFCE